MNDWPELVHLWFKDILPALPQILGPILGGIYSAGLVLRGQIAMDAQPCIRIESPNIPASAAQQTVEEEVTTICKRMDHEPICIHFTRGSLKSLNGGEQHRHDDAEECAECQQRRFNLVRPSRRPFMGASIGLLCSKKIVASWGGVVLIQGKNFMLTSDHFVTESQMAANKDGSGSDGFFTSPSQYDLWEMERNLKQSKRNLDAQTKKMMQETYPNCEISEDSLSDPTFFTPDLRATQKKAEDTMKLLDQVTKPPEEYIVGKVYKRSLEPRKAKVPRNLAEKLKLQNEKNEVTHFMDWSLCSLSSGSSQSVENQHKYRSSEDAMADEYVDEEERSQDIEPGDICHETCDPESGVAVHYVGQGSNHRSGSINIPMLVRRDSISTYEWSIISADGRDILYPSVAGDSGAWIIRTQDNKIVGQVQAHSNNQVLFTPINVLFADVEQRCETQVSLPPSPHVAAQIAIATPALPLCAIKGTPPIVPYKFLEPSFVSETLSDESLGKIRFSITKSPEASIKLSCHVKEQGAKDRGSSDLSSYTTSSPPSLTNSPRSPESLLDLPESSQISAGQDPYNPLGESKDVSASAGSPGLSNPPEPNVLVLSSDKLDEHQAVTSAPTDISLNTEFLFRVSPTARSPTWPIDSKGKTTENMGHGVVQHQPSNDHEMPIRSHWNLTIGAWLAGRRGTCVEHVTRATKIISFD